MRRLGVLIASTGVALALGATAASAADFIEQRVTREEVFAPPVRERVVVERPVVRERVVVERPVRERVVVERPVVRERIIRERVVVERPLEERIVRPPVEEEVVVRKVAPPAPVVYEDEGPAFIGAWGPSWRHRGWDGWDHRW